MEQPLIGMRTHLQSFVVLQICKRQSCASAAPSWETFLVRNTTETKHLEVCFHKPSQPSLSILWTVKSSDSEPHCRAFLQGKCRDGENCSWKPRSQVSESTPCFCTCCWRMLKTSDTTCHVMTYPPFVIMCKYNVMSDDMSLWNYRWILHTHSSEVCSRRLRPPGYRRDLQDPNVQFLRAWALQEGLQVSTFSLVVSIFKLVVSNTEIRLPLIFMRDQISHPFWTIYWIGF